MTEFETPDPISAVMELGVADVRIVAGERSDTVVEVQPTDAAKPADVSAAEQTRVEYEAGRLLVRTPRRWKGRGLFGETGSVDVHVSLPAGSEVTGEAHVGAIRCTGALGDCRLKTSVGSLYVDRVRALELYTAVGDISVERADGDVKVTTASGRVWIGAIGGGGTITNSNGSTRVGEAIGELRVKSANGDIAVERSDGSVNAKTANGDIQLGGVRRGSVVAESAFGAIEVAIAEGTSAWLDLVTRTGQLHNKLVPSERPEPGEDRVEVRARTAFGDITVERAAAAEPGEELSAADRTPR